MPAAIAFHLEGLAQDGDPIPEPSGPRRLRRTRHGASVSPTTDGGQTAFKLHDGVRLRREEHDFPAGTEGAIVQVFSEQNVYGVEWFKRPGETIGLVDASADDLEPAPNRSAEPRFPRCSLPVRAQLASGRVAYGSQVKGGRHGSPPKLPANKPWS